MKQYLDIAALAERLRIKRSTLYAWAEQGTIPHVKLGRLLRFDPDEIEAWLQNHRREGIPQPASPPRQHGTDDVDTLIAEAKRAVYTSCRGKPDQDRATRKGDTHGSV
jgi:excisionase family DNA binding protein